MFDPMDTENIWSAEGLTCYTTYRIVKELYGEAVAQAAFIDQWQEEVDSYYKDFYVRHPDTCPLCRSNTKPTSLTVCGVCGDTVKWH